jgi:hypothetical protein
MSGRVWSGRVRKGRVGSGQVGLGRAGLGFSGYGCVGFTLRYVWSGSVTFGIVRPGYVTLVFGWVQFG